MYILLKKYLLYFLNLGATLAVISAHSAATAQQLKANAHTSKETIISYTLSPDFITKRLHIHCQFTSRNKTQTTLMLPYEWGGWNFRDLVENLRLSSKGSPLSFQYQNTNNKAVVTHAPNQLIDIHYDIRCDPKNADIHGPVFNENYIHIIGLNFIIAPKKQSGASYKSKIIWDNLPKNWTCTSDANVGRAYLLDDPYYSLFTAGTRPLQKIDLLGKPVFLRFSGKTGPQSEQKIKETVRSIFEFQRKFWNDETLPNTLIDIHIHPSQGDLGTCLKHAITLTLSPHTQKNELLDIVSNTHLYLWTGMRLIPNLQPKLYWWSEGFTKYLSTLLLYKSGLYSIDQYIKTTNQHLKEYYMSPAQHLSNDAISKTHLNNKIVAHIPYGRGFIFAFYLDALIRKHSQGTASFLDLMKSQIEWLKSNNSQLESTTLQTSLNSLIQKYVPGGISNAFNRYINKGETIDLDEIESQTGLTQVTLHHFDLGFSLEAFKKEHIIRNLKSNSEAYRAGLRENDRVEGPLGIVITQSPIGNSVSDANQHAHAKVGDKTITFQPKGQKTITLPQIREKNAQTMEQLFGWLNNKNPQASKPIKPLSS